MWRFNMLSYQHGYHAGNPADIHKHLTLVTVGGYLLKKAAGIHFFDTHAGKGLYSLQDSQAQKRQEYVEGVQQLIGLRDQLPSEWHFFFDSLDTLHGGKVTPENLQYYPGSPHWVSALRRAQDKHTVFELHPGEHEQLAELNSDHTGYVVYGDGLKGVVSMLPPRIPRMLVLIDPAYEMANEYADVANTVAVIMQKCRHAVVLVWYPLLAAEKHISMCEDIIRNTDAPVLQSEWIYKERPEGWGMYGSGMLVVNPPWVLQVQLTDALQPLADLLGQPVEHRVLSHNAN